MWVGIVYVTCVVIADILAARWMIPLGFGIMVPAGVFAFAPIFTIRDMVHEEFGKRGAYYLIALASGIAWLLAAITGSGALAVVTLASVIAFVVNEALDTEIYAALRERSRFLAIMSSNAVSAAVDSVLFIAIAFGWIWGAMIGQYVVKMIIATILGLILRHIWSKQKEPVTRATARWRS